MAKDEINFFGKKTTKKELKKITKEEMVIASNKAIKYTMTFVTWYLFYKSLTVFWWDKNVMLSILYTLMSINISMSNKLYNLEKKLKIKGVI